MIETYSFDTYLKKRSANNGNKLLAGFSYKENDTNSKVSDLNKKLSLEAFSKALLKALDYCS